MGPYFCNNLLLEDVKWVGIHNYFYIGTLMQVGSCLKFEQLAKIYHLNDHYFWFLTKLILLWELFFSWPDLIRFIVYGDTVNFTENLLRKKKILHKSFAAKVENFVQRLWICSNNYSKFWTHINKCQFPWLLYFFISSFTRRLKASCLSVFSGYCLITLVTTSSAVSSFKK